MSSMQRTIQRTILRNRNGKMRHYRYNGHGEYDRTPRAFKAERQRQAEKRLRWPFGRKRENKSVTKMPKPQASGE